MSDMLKEHLIHLAKHIIQVFDAHDIFYWADYGTLLGIIRDGDIIEGDDDLDFGLLAKDRDKILAIKKDLEKDGHSFQPKEDGKDKIIIVPPGTNMKVMADFFYWHEDENGMMYRKTYVFDYEQGAKFDKRHLNLQQVPAFGTTVNIPSEVEDFLVMRYGNWQTKNDDYKRVGNS